ncbi:AMP-binding protein [Persicimonas caeni]|uniref:AMP-binding protein n=1 Tax=Persicimonas caeni TaxID=2292766 RepID=A0A4Y6PZL4_PERCE|nr:AMP-binding protein [Persicimonas caeni]QDG53447.1 AMP-binding protein [Persicimonas caeni]QED34668.1 AMP-binding protein [Persicimonas caeni]
MQEDHSFARARQLLLDQRTDYDTARAEFEWPRLDTFNWALDWFDPMAEGNDELALLGIDDDGTQHKVTFDEMRRRSNQVANFLADQGIERGDRVLLMLPNVVPLWEAMLGLMKLGAVTIPATVLLTDDDLADRLERGEVSHVIVWHEETEKFEELLDEQTRISVGGEVDGWQRFEGSTRADASFSPDADTPADSPLLLYFTSGTTAAPKLVMHTHQSYPVGHLSTMYWLGLQPGDNHLNISSAGWAKHAWSSFFAPWIAGATVVYLNYDRFDADWALQTIADCKVTSICAPPTVWRLFIQHDLGGYDVSLREIVSAGEPLNPKVIDKIDEAWGLRPRDGYGQTETTAQIANTPDQPIKEGSMGRPLPGYDIVLLDADDEPIDGPGEGQIAIRLDPAPVGLMAGYYGDETSSREKVGGEFYLTGDVAERDEDGYITYVGRADDVFKSSGYRISPFELESFIIRHEAVAEAAVVPSPHATRGEIPKAFLTLKEGYEPGEEVARSIFAMIREDLSGYKRIRRIEFLELPKTVSGKIRRVELRRSEVERGPEGEQRDNEFWYEQFRD